MTIRHLSVLRILKLSVEQFDAVIVTLVLSRLPTDVKRSWEIETSSLVNLPVWHTLREFVESRIHELDI